MATFIPKFEIDDKKGSRYKFEIVAAVVCTIAAIVLLVKSPDVQVQDVSYLIDNKSSGVYWNNTLSGNGVATMNLEITDVDKLQMYLLLEVAPLNKLYKSGTKQTESNFNMEFVVSLWTETGGSVYKRIEGDVTHKRKVHCSMEDLECDSVELIHLRELEYQNYYLQIELANWKEFIDQIGNLKYTLSGLNSKFTKMYIISSTVFLVATAILLVEFLICLWSRLHRTFWITEQKLLVLILLTQLLYNNPVIFIQAYHPNGFLTFLVVLGDTVFLSTLLLFWLSAFERMATDPNYESKKSTLGIAKTAFTLFTMLIFLVVYSYVIFKTVEQPGYNVEQESPTFFLICEILLILFTIIYFIWLLKLITTAAPNVRRKGSRHKVGFAAHIIVMVSVVVGILSYSFRDTLNEPMVKLFFMIIFVFYSLILCTNYRPHPCSSRESHEAHVEMQQNELHFIRGSYGQLGVQDEVLNDQDVRVELSNSSSSAGRQTSESSNTVPLGDDDNDDDDQEEEKKAE
eukprot:CAMPEP_0114991622 /NCGR_PEP_ID=MMETSP0216-20121206/11479_1 /TAXON_ID=223996 /ORGANISM="Protocruzia adherens, Strain Boccale" /LENGTH=514 /DNA_ID=CAMNT_0002354979 /DNA_START=167 /DNA_END=1711 /DNA_ORIENTATION=+